ncbi:hypothetical protein D3C72_708670 [compost metagenome]
MMGVPGSYTKCQIKLLFVVWQPMIKEKFMREGMANLATGLMLITANFNLHPLTRK